MEFTNNWFAQNAKDLWDRLFQTEKPKKILEIGSYEGASVCHLIKTLGNEYPLEIHCIDTWEGGIEHKKGGLVESNMSEVEARFLNNTRIAIGEAAHPIELVLHKGYSDAQLAKLLADGKAEHFDFVYVDGSHQAPDVLIDAVLSFKLLRVGGVLGFDDYLWSEPLPYGHDPIRCPKIAVDSFVNIYCRKLHVMPGGRRQLYTRKTAS